MRRILLFLPLALFVLLGLLFWRGLGQDPSFMPAALAGKPLPEFEMPTLEGQTVRSADLHGRIALINVWATWCPTCAVEHAYLGELARTGVLIYGVNYKDDPDAARAWLAEKGNPYALNIVDREGRLGLDLGVTGAPETYLLDAGGVVRMRRQGVVDARVWEQEFAPLIRALQAGGTP